MTAMGAGTGLRPLGIGELLDAAVKVYRNNFKTLTLAVLIPMLGVSILQALIGLSMEDDQVTTNADGTIESIPSGFWVSLLVLFLLFAVAFAITNAACFHAVIHGYLGDGTTWRKSLAYGAKRILPLIVLGIVTILGVLFMSILLLLPGIWLYVKWCVAPPALMAEGVGPFKALGRSFRLTKGRWWATFLVLILTFILVFVIQIIAFAFLGIAFADADNEVLGVVVSILVNAFSYALTLPIQAAVLTILYYDMRVRHEGYDLQLALGGDGSEQAAVAPQTWGPSDAGQPAAPVSWGAADTAGSAPPPPGGGFSTPKPGGFAPPAAPQEPEERPTGGSPPGAA